MASNVSAALLVKRGTDRLSLAQVKDLVDDEGKVNEVLAKIEENRAKLKVEQDEITRNKDELKSALADLERRENEFDAKKIKFENETSLAREETARLRRVLDDDVEAFGKEKQADLDEIGVAKSENKRVSAALQSERDEVERRKSAQDARDAVQEAREGQLNARDQELNDREASLIRRQSAMAAAMEVK